MKQIKLTQGKFAIVDDEDFHYLSRFKWSYEDTVSGKFVSCEIGGKLIYMHQLIMPAKKGYYLKHLNDNNLDNRKENFEMISINHRRHLGLKKRIGTSIYRGVQRSSQNKWHVVIQKDGIRYSGGHFDLKDEKEAGLAYNRLAKEHYGSFAYQNKIE